MRNSFFFPVVLLVLLLLQDFSAAQGAFTPEQYRKALWMVTRFYGAQRDGAGPNWLLMDHEYKTSFLKDGETDGIDLVGGWFDCGDNVLFGQTFFYSAYMLAKAYDVFPKGFHDDYHGWDYSDYAESAENNNNCKDWNMSCGEGDGIPDLLQELKYATDWIIKATPNANTIYYQKGRAKGNGGDHQLWITSGYKATLNRTQGGEADTPRPVYKDNAGGDVASFAAATLAVMSRIYRKYDPDYADLSLEHARYAYQYASTRKNAHTVDPESCCYTGAGTAKVPVMFHIASGEMYKATGETAFYNDMLTETISRNWAFDYANPHDLAAYVSATTLTENSQSHIANMRTQFAQYYRGDAATADNDEHSTGISKVGGSWGAVRYLGNHAFSAALYANLADTDEFDEFIYRQIDFILGKNRRDYSFLVGFDDHGGEMAQKPHHRNVFLNDDNILNESNYNDLLVIPERNKYFGYMVGGHRNPNKYVDDVLDYSSTEGGIDYNAGFLGALAYIVSKVAPADEITPVKISPAKTSFQNSVVRFVGTHEFAAQNKSFTVRVFDLKGNEVSVIKSNGQAVRFTPKSNGIYYATVK